MIDACDWKSIVCTIPCLISGHNVSTIHHISLRTMNLSILKESTEEEEKRIRIIIQIHM